MKYTLPLSALLLTTSLLQADIAGGEISLGYLNDQPSGNLAYKGNGADVEKDFGWDKESSFVLKAYIEHPVPVLPNIRAVYSKIAHSGNGTVTTLTYGDKTFSGDIATDMDLNIIDGTLYYEILDNWVNLDIGLNAKYIDASTYVENDFIGKSDKDFSVVLPTLYAKARLDIPMSDLSFQAEGDIITYDGNTLYDLYLTARYTFFMGLGVEAGVKMLKLKLDDVEDVTADIDFKGLYAAVVWDF
jgi:outer membrane protein